MSTSKTTPPTERDQGAGFRWASLSPFGKPLHRDLTFQVLVGMIVGVLLGIVVPAVGVNLNLVSTLFIHLIQMIVGLVVFCTVTLGIAKVRDFGKVGKIAIKAILYFEIITTFALAIGLIMINILQPGVGMHINPADLDGADQVTAAKPMTFSSFIIGLVPTSAVGAFAEGNVLQILVFSALFGCGVAAVGAKADPLVRGIDSVQRSLFWVIGRIMRLAPLAACAAIAYSVSSYGLDSLLSLGALVLEFFLTVIVFFLIIFWPVSRIAGISLWKMMRYFREELLLVIGTSSSESVFPQLTVKLTRLGIKEEVVGLVLPTSYSFNHDGTCLYWAATSVFLAQATDTHLGLGGQLSLMFVLLLTSKGGAGVSGSAIPMLALTLAATGTIPVASVALILGVHKILSGAFVFTNIAGNCLATIFVAKTEKAIDWTIMRRELDSGGIRQPTR
ncbi:cation:dicarboxylate symporter family transporter [Microlunatus soli]|uniref:Aerobic C4-dicarboxylate transport protein n=1 Tax=Microlunatus soli TaxID=630515 RepID=A0A1H1YM81_9ACTN|nr:cation:dicarboxylase symporter family transporter [Microlunatus soli]SDT22520.1 aerobic C4-dicarboxylate transport protein [Microlunatus soli]